VFVRVDGGPAQQIGVLNTPTGTIPYEAIADGKSHTYVFYSEGVDGAENVQAPPSDAGGGLTVTAKFQRPASLQPEGLMVQDDQAEPSSIRTVDLLFNENAGLSSLVRHGDIHLLRHKLGGGNSPVPLKKVVHVVDQAIEFDFGAAGLAAHANGNAAGGYYEIDVHLDGLVDRYFFSGTLGDVHGGRPPRHADRHAGEGSKRSSGR
jgi:hypothetical protein